MPAYIKEYLNDVVENQGKLFDLVAQSYPDKDTKDFINSYIVLPKIVSFFLFVCLSLCLFSIIDITVLSIEKSLDSSEEMSISHRRIKLISSATTLILVLCACILLIYYNF